MSNAAMSLSIKHGNQRIGELFVKAKDANSFIFKTGPDFKDVKKNSCKVEFFSFDKLSGQLRAITYAIDWLVQNTDIPKENIIFEEWSEDNISPEIHAQARKVYDRIQKILAKREEEALTRRLANKKAIKEKKNKPKIEIRRKKKVVTERGSKVAELKEVLTKTKDYLCAEQIIDKTGFSEKKSDRVYVYVMLKKLEKAKEVSVIKKPSPTSKRVIKYYRITPELSANTAENKKA